MTVSAQTSSQGTSVSPSFYDDPDEICYRLTQGNEHPVMWYVKNLPFEDAVYPANMYQRVNGTTAGRTDRHLITWSPPAHDRERKLMKGCGFIHASGSSGDEGIVHTACSGDREHYIRSKRNHCWSLTCPACCNDTALRMGSRIEEQLLSYAVLKEKQGEDPGNLGHWVISPEQGMMKLAMQTEEDFTAVRRHITDELMRIGAKAGVLVFHPWRQKEDQWSLMPHFHSILYGFLDTDSFREDNPGWVIKKVHANETMESIGQTAAYLATHMGIPQVERHPEEVDWDLKFMEHMFPGLYDDYDKSKQYKEMDGFRIRKDVFRWDDNDLYLQSQGKGRMCGDISSMDWIGWTKDKLHRSFNISYFGEANQNNFRRVAIEKDRRTRVCRQCGAPLNIYSGLCDIHGDPAQYTFENTIRTFKRHHTQVKQAIEQLQPQLRANRTTIGRITPKTALLVSSDEVRLDNR